MRDVRHFERQLYVILEFNVAVLPDPDAQAHNMQTL